MSRPQRNLLVAALTLVAAGLMELGLGLFGDGARKAARSMSLCFHGRRFVSVTNQRVMGQ